MLSKLQKISKKLALIAAIWVLFIAVHGIFVHKHQELNADVHACVLCEIVSTDSVFPQVLIPEAYSEFIQAEYSEITCNFIYIVSFHDQSRGPPSGFLL